jgi:hypothetical protein
MSATVDCLARMVPPGLFRQPLQRRAIEPLDQLAAAADPDRHPLAQPDRDDHFAQACHQLHRLKRSALSDSELPRNSRTSCQLPPPAIKRSDRHALVRTKPADCQPASPKPLQPRPPTPRQRQIRRPSHDLALTRDSENHQAKATVNKPR